jgi:hypothetical protein
MHDRKADIDENAMERGIRQDLEEHIHGMVIDVRLEEVVKTAHRLVLVLARPFQRIQGDEMA